MMRNRTVCDCFINASDFSPSNDWEKNDLRIETVDPSLPPSTPWTGEELRLKFRFFKTKFGLVDDAFCRSGNLEAGADIDEADRFYGHITRLMENEDANLHTLLMFAFWAYDKKPPKFISQAKPVSDQFDTSAPRGSINDNGVSRKRQRLIHDNESVAKAIKLLAPNPLEQEKKLKYLLKKQFLKEY
jgi:hypothetical protein